MGNTNISCCIAHNKQPEQEMKETVKSISSSSGLFQNTTINENTQHSASFKSLPQTHSFLSSHLNAPESIVKYTKIQHAFKTHLSLAKLHSLFLHHKQTAMNSLLKNTYPIQLQTLPSEQYYQHLLSEYKVYPYQQTQYYITKISQSTKYSFPLAEPILSSDKSHIYVGSFNINEQYHGYGVLYDLEGSTRLEGLWSNGLLNGYGRLFKGKGEYAVGNFKSNLLNGENGYYYYKDGSVFNGEFVNGVPNGSGRISFEDGSVFEGSFVNGEKVYGKFVWSDGKYYQGDIKGDLFEGFGVYEWGGNRRYEGEWKEGKMQGKGKIWYIDGTYYEGMFYDNQRNGLGKYVWNDDKWYEGEWKDGKQNGNGVYYKSGVVLKGLWNNGNVVKESKRHKTSQKKSMNDNNNDSNRLLTSENNSVIISAQDIIPEEQTSPRKAMQ